MPVPAFHNPSQQRLFLPLHWRGYVSVSWPLPSNQQWALGACGMLFITSLWDDWDDGGGIGSPLPGLGVKRADPHQDGTPAGGGRLLDALRRRLKVGWVEGRRARLRLGREDGASRIEMKARLGIRDNHEPDETANKTKLRRAPRRQWLGVASFWKDAVS